MIQHFRKFDCRFCERSVLHTSEQARITDALPPLELPAGWHIIWNMFVCDSHKVVIDGKVAES